MIRVFLHIEILKVKSYVDFRTLPLKSHEHEQVIQSLSQVMF